MCKTRPCTRLCIGRDSDLKGGGELFVLHLQLKHTIQCRHFEGRQELMMANKIVLASNILTFRLQVSLKQHLAGLREHLLVAMVPLGGQDSVMSEEEVESAVQEEGGMGRVMRTVLDCVQQLCRASSNNRGNEEVGSK